MRGWLRSIAVGFLTALAPASAGVAAQSLSPGGQAPPAWLVYAEIVDQRLVALLTTTEPAAVRVRAQLDATRSTETQPSLALRLRLWIDTAGTITRAEAEPIVTDAMVIALREALVGQSIGAPPPPGMPLPLRLAIRLEAEAPPAAEQ